MIDDPSSPSSVPSITPAMLAEDALYYREVLHGLIEIGAEMVRMAHRDAQADQAEPKSYAEAVAMDAAAEAGRAVARMERCAAVVERLSRCVRRSIGLARQLSVPVRPLAAPALEPGSAESVVAHGLRREVLRSVEDAIHQEGERVDGDALRTELYERLEMPELAEDLARRPVAEVIAEIRRDLGLVSSAWVRRRPEDLVSLSERARPRVPGLAWWPAGVAADDAGCGGEAVAPGGMLRGPGQSPGAA